MADQTGLNAVMLAAEVSPFAKVGGLADVLGALPKALERIGVRVTVILPGYKSINHDQYGIRPCEMVAGFDVPMGPGSAYAEVFQTRLPRSAVDVFLIGSDRYFHRDGIYDDPVTHEGYLDNMERFVFFMKAGLELLPKLGLRPDIIHCHDSQTGLIPGLLRTGYLEDPFYAGTGTLFTIHNLAYQGIYPKDTLYWAGIDYRHFYPTSPFEFWGKVNFMKVAIEHADQVNTVSENYAKEIQSSPEYGYGLEGILRLRTDSLSGIVNGIDYEEWNPEMDPLIAAHFSQFDLSGKTVCKSEILRSFGLPPMEGRVPLIGIVSRLADQKGFDLIETAVDEIGQLSLKLVILGKGQRRYHRLLQHIAAQYPERVGVKLEFDNRLAHLIQAGSDMLLMPSRYEPCGLNQLHSLRCGTVPIVRATGGLVDTVIDYTGDGNAGTGFSFNDYTAENMAHAIRRALAAFSDESRWMGIVRRGMSQDWSWQQSARKYLHLYQKIQALRP